MTSIILNLLPDMKLNFSKYHGAGNDFLLIDCRDSELKLSPSVIMTLCDRHFGIGADGVLLLSLALGFDFRMHYFNSDGSEATFCGNGARCLVAFAADKGIQKDNYYFVAADGEHTAHLISEYNGTRIITLGMQDAVIYSTSQDECYLNTGTYHVVKFVEDVNAVDVEKIGRSIRYDSIYEPHGTNVNFVTMKHDTLYIRTYEKGVENETLSCGTGATAAAITASILYGGNQFKVITKGGGLDVSFRIDNHTYFDVKLTGEAVKVFEGSVEV